MYVLSNNGKIYGAAEIMNQKAMDEIAEKLGGDFVVLPSSVHETIILPLNEDMDCNTLDSMIQEINVGVLDEKDKLSDHAFQYDSENHELVRMDKMQERKQEKEVEKSEKSVESKAEIKAEKGQKSLMDRISSKKEEVAKKEATKPQPSKKRDVALS
jgi:trehalose utilization protein